MDFKLTSEQTAKLTEWKEKICDLFGEYGTYDYIFTPLGVGVMIKVRSHLTNTILDLTDEENW